VQGAVRRSAKRGAPQASPGEMQCRFCAWYYVVRQEKCKVLVVAAGVNAVRGVFGSYYEKGHCRAAQVGRHSVYTQAT
jgi:hypothetical protein